MGGFFLIASVFVTLAVFSLLIFPSEKSKREQCSVLLMKRRGYNICIKPIGHEGNHMCADGQEF